MMLCPYCAAILRIRRTTITTSLYQFSISSGRLLKLGDPIREVKYEIECPNGCDLSDLDIDVKKLFYERRRKW